MVKVNKKIILKVINFNDPHITTIPPRSRKGNYIDCIAAKIKEMAGIGNDYDVDIFTCTGDIFHRKGNTTAFDITEAIRILKPLEKWFPIYCIVGNHDSPESHTANTKAICTLEAAGVIHLVSRNPVIKNGILICGVDYDRQNVSNVKGVLPDIKQFKDMGNIRGVLVLSHANLWRGGKFPGGGNSVLVSKVADKLVHNWLSMPIVICNGHLHFNQHSKTDIIFSPFIHNLGVDFQGIMLSGSLTRVARDEDNNNPNFNFIQYFETDSKLRDVFIDGRVVELVNVKSAKDVFIDPVEESKNDNEVVIEFVKALQDDGGEIDGIKLKQLVKRVSDELNMSNEVCDLALSYIG